MTVVSPRGDSVLHVATKKGDLSVLDSLLEAMKSRQQDINVTDGDGYTPVYHAFHANR